MPKLVNDREKELILEALYQNTIELIKEKGLRNVTVDNITQRANMAKGSFYKYYPSKEVFLYEVIKRSEREGFTRTENILSESKPNKELLVEILKGIYIADDSIVLYVTPHDIEALMRKLPAEYYDREAKKSDDYFERTLHAIGAHKGIVSIGVIAHLMDSLSFIASSKDGRAGSEESKAAMELIINTIADYLMEALKRGGMAK